MMKTAKDVIKDSNLHNQLEMLLLTDDIIKIIHSYACEACKEQREMCADAWIHSDVESYETILNAPQPQLL